MKPYTVLLLYPESIAEQYGEDTYLAHVEADNWDEAVGLAQGQACDEGELELAPDFLPLLVIAGHHDDLLGQYHLIANEEEKL